MATDIFKNIRIKKGDAEKSYQWFQNQVKNLTNNTNSESLMKNTKQLETNIIPGNMYLFYYDPKFKDSLPYYDKFPLALPFRTVKNGFYGINLHYMPYMIRFRLLEKLTEYTTDNNLNDDTRIKISWNLLLTFSRYAPIQGSVKHYLLNHVKSRFLKINYPDWLTASQLPIEQFEGANKSFVWKEARKISGQ